MQRCPCDLARIDVQDHRREVFAYGGKTDIYIPVAALHPESADARTTYYFYAEAKMGTGETLAEHAWSQAEGYRALRVRRVVLLFYVVARDLIGATERTLDAFRGRGVWREVDTGLPPTTCRFVADRDGLGPIEVTIIFVHTPRLRDAPPA